MNATKYKRLQKSERTNGTLKRPLAEALLDIHKLKSIFGIQR